MPERKRFFSIDVFPKETWPDQQKDTVKNNNKDHLEELSSDIFDGRDEGRPWWGDQNWPKDNYSIKQDLWILVKMLTFLTIENQPQIHDIGYFIVVGLDCNIWGGGDGWRSLAWLANPFKLPRAAEDFLNRNQLVEVLRIGRWMRNLFQEQFPHHALNSMLPQLVERGRRCRRLVGRGRGVANRCIERVELGSSHRLSSSYTVTHTESSHSHQVTHGDILAAKWSVPAELKRKGVPTVMK